MILIKGMEMPKCCCVCPCFNDEYCYCQAADKDLGSVLIDRRHPDCPLIEVPPHGRLIDLDGIALAQYYDEEHEDWSMKTVTLEDILWEVCENMPPIIIPADKDGEA